MSHILVVDDDQNICQLISEYLKKDGHEVQELFSGEGLVERIRQNPPDCLILDIVMPGVNGLQLLTAIRGFSELPIIMVSAEENSLIALWGLSLAVMIFWANRSIPVNW